MLKPIYFLLIALLRIYEGGNLSFKYSVCERHTYNVLYDNLESKHSYTLYYAYLYIILYASITAIYPASRVSLFFSTLRSSPLYCS